jgi:gluconolactonase
VRRDPELDFQGLFRVGPDPEHPGLLVDDFDRPNGLCFSLDESRLFVNDTARRHVRVFDVRPGGALGGGRLWAETRGTGPGAPDGMRLDSAGNLYCCGPGGIHLFDPHGALREVIEVPECAANLAFGDADLRSLLVTASTSLYRIRVRTPGLPAF